MPAGRPLKFESKEKLQNLIDLYFLQCKDEKGEWKKPPTITGLANSLDTNRETLLNYEEKEEYFDTIKRAKEQVHQYVEEYLFTGKNQTGAIFNLKNNYGWKDKTETDVTTGGDKIMGINYVTPNGNQSDTDN